MIRLSYPSAPAGQRTIELEHDVIRFGTDAACELHLAGAEHGVLPLHGELVRQGETWCLKALHPSWVNGQAGGGGGPLRGGDRIRVGSPDGPEIHLLEAGPVEDDEPTSQVQPEMLVALMEADKSEPEVTDASVSVVQAAPTELTELPAEPERRDASATEVAYQPGPPPAEGTDSLVRALKAVDAAPQEVAHALTRAKEAIDQARSDAGGGRSGRTLLIMAHALAGVSETGEKKTRRWRRWLAGALVLSAAMVAGLGAVIWAQNRRISALVAEKAQIDAQIQAVLLAMDNEDDAQRLAELEKRWELLVGIASDKLSEVKRASAVRAEELSRPTDPLDREIRKILHSFHADTYAIPPVFRRALQEQVDELRKAPNLSAAYERKRQLWPDIEAALKRKELPTELGFIAFTESSFDPDAVNPRSGAAGMWQLMDPVARHCGISTAPGNDERFNPRKSSEAAACHLSNLLVEFGEESFMLALASYNRGENGVRRALHQLAEQPGGFRQRDFWALYRLKYLPEETREYVPKVLAAAIVLAGAEAGAPP